jgi:hypothetical protein
VEHQQRYSRTNFIITICLVAFTNYLLVANLEVVVTACSSLYRSPRGPIIKRMKEDRDDKWSKKGIAFLSFRPEREKVEPPEWYIPWFVVIELVRKIGFLKAGKTKDPISRVGGGNAQEPVLEETTDAEEDLDVQRVDKGKGIAGGSTSNEGKEGKMKESTSDSVLEVKSEDTTAQTSPRSGVHFKQ